MRRIPPLLVAFLVAGNTPVAAESVAGPVIIQQLPPAIQVKTYNPDNPTDRPPRLEADMAGDTVFDFLYDVHVNFTYDGATPYTITVTSLDVKLSLPVTIWLPDRADPSLVAHEQGHRRISESIYQSAGAVARKCAGELLGNSFTGQGTDPESARKEAVDEVVDAFGRKYLAATSQLTQRYSEFYDELTDHNRNKSITADQAVTETFERLGNPMARSR